MYTWPRATEPPLLSLIKPQHQNPQGIRPMF